MLDSLLVIELLGCSILSLCLKKRKEVYFYHQLLIFLLVMAILFFLIFFPHFSGRCITYFQPSCNMCLAEMSKVANFWIWKLYIAWEVNHIIICMQYPKISNANSGKYLVFQLHYCLQFLDNLIYGPHLIGRCWVAICFGWISLVWETWWPFCIRWFWGFLLWVEAIK